MKMNELLQDFLNLDINKSTGTDNIGPMILKVSALFIVSPLKGNFAKKIFFYMFFLMYKYGCLYVY